MPSESLGRLLEELCADASAELVLCAPFAKTAVVARLLAKVSSPDIDLLLITRWRPEEVANGVSDLGVLDAVERAGGRVVLHDQLHAKYFRTKGRVLLGSANLTGRALGWTWPSNLELLADVSEEEVSSLEQRLLLEGIRANAEMAEDVQRRADLLGRPPLVEDVLVPPADGPWLPSLRYPQDLYEAYTQGLASLSRQSAHDAARDLLALAVLPDLPRHDFERSVGDALWSSRILQIIRPTLVAGARFGAVTAVLQDQLRLDRAAAQTSWQTLMRWLLTFCGDRVELKVARWSEVLVLRPHVPGEGGSQRT